MPARSYRPLIIGRNGAVASNHPEATRVGLDILRAGGNAVDATVATAFAVGVAEPHMSGIGGDGFYHLHRAGSSTSIVFNASGGAPKAASIEAFPEGIPKWGPKTVSTPGMVAGLSAMHANHGTMPWDRLVAPAVEIARFGFGVTHAYRRYSGQERKRIMDDPQGREIFLPTPDASPPPIGSLIKQPELAATLEEIAADRGESFYRGALAKRLSAALQARGGLVGEEDLAGFQPEEQAPISVSYRGYEVRQTPPNSTGFVLLQMLKIVERFDLSRIEPESADLIHLLVEAKKLAFFDRERFGTDPKFGDIPIERLLSESYADECFGRIDPTRAAETAAPVNADGDTTYFCVVDKEGNAVSAIQSINSSFGSGVVAGDTGVLLNNRMLFWHLDPGHANLLQPGKRVRHTMNAPMVFKDGKLWCVCGTPGRDNQVQINLQILTSMIDFGYDPQQAVEAPRWSSSQPGQDANYPHDGEFVITMEGRFDPDVMAELERRGHRIDRVDDLGGPCNAEVIRVDAAAGTLLAGSDPRRDGWAAAY